MDKADLTQADVYNFLARHKAKGQRVLSMLGKHKPFYDAVTSDIGKEIFADLMDRMDSLIEKSLIGGNDIDRAVYVELRKIAFVWGEKISNYNKWVNEVRQEGGE